MVRVVPYGGVREIGGNKLLVEDGDTRLFLDFGMSFGAHGRYFAEFLKPRTNSGLRDLLALGILPEIDGIYRHDACRHPGAATHLPDEDRVEDLWDAPVRSYDEHVEAEGAPFVDGVVLTHAHADHYGHIGYLDRRIPIFCTPTTATMLEAIQEVTSTGGFEAELVTGKTKAVDTYTDAATFPDTPKMVTGETWERAIDRQAPYEPFSVGGFEVTLIPVDHSVPGAASVLVEAPDGTRVYYTGDVRFHGVFEEVTRRLRETVDDLGPDVMLCEGTRIDQDEPDDERQVLQDLEGTFAATEGLALVDFGWKDTTRFETVHRAAQAAGRELVVSYKLAFVLDRLVREGLAERSVADLDDVHVYVRRADSMLYSPGDYTRDKTKMGYVSGREWDRDDLDRDRALAHLRDGVRAADIRRRPDDLVVMLSQWEMTELLDLRPPPGSRFVRAACEPFSDEMEIDLARQANWLKAFDIPVRETDDGVELPEATHASGHASGPHLMDFVKRVQPETLVPIHTEAEAVFQERFDNVVPPEVGTAIEA